MLNILLLFVAVLSFFNCKTLLNILIRRSNKVNFLAILVFPSPCVFGVCYERKNNVPAG
jgi:hypothetical protein